MNNQRGMSVIAVTTVLMLIALLALAASSLIPVRTDMSSESLNSMRTFYIAESGLSVAKHTLHGNWSRWSDPSFFPKTSFAGGTFDTGVSAGSDPTKEVVVTVTAAYGDSKRVIQSQISRYSQAMTSAVYTNGDYSIGGSAEVVGDAVASDNPIPTLDSAAAIAAAIANHLNGYARRADGNYFRGDFSSNPSALNGVIFIDTFTNGNPANVTISGNISTDDGNPAFLIVMGNLKISGTVVFHGLIYTTGAAGIDVELKGNMTLDGALITSGDADLTGNSSVTYNGDMVITDTTTTLLSGVEAPWEKSWQEPSP